MLVIAHRGASGYAPEHTFAAYDLALRLGCDYLEQDLQMTRDGVLVCMHDETLDRTAGGCTGRIIDRTWHEIENCDVGSWFNRAVPDRARAAFAGERIPTLDDVLARYRNRTAFYIETKVPEAAPGMEEELLRLLARHDLVDAARDEWRVLIQSFSEASLRRIAARDAQLPLIQLIAARTTSVRIQALLDRIGSYAVGIGPERGDVDRALVAAAHARGLHVHPYTVNDRAEMQRLTDAGVDGMFTNFSDRLIALRPEDELRGVEAVRRAARAARRPS
jgi:glycerophosphoryl diester phosphodiesterase